MKRIALVIATVLLAFTTLNAQDYRATILGTVTDPTGAAIPGARVTVTNIATGLVSRSSADGEGAFTIPLLLPGNYTMQVQQQGFNTFIRNGVVLQANGRVRIDVKLVIGQLSTKVEVTGQAPLLDTADANNGQGLGTQDLEKLPSHFLTPTNEISLAPGVTWASTSRVYFRPFDTQLDYSINGGGRAQNNLELDGISDNSLTYYETRPSGIAYQPPLEATQETKVITNIYDAEYGRTLGGIVNLITKSGANRLHGAAYYDMHRTYLNANTYANNQNHSAKAPDHVDQYGFEVDGPVVIPKIYNGKKRTFFMFAYEHYYQSTVSSSAIGSVPTDLQRQGDFSQTYNAKGQLITIYDPNTTRPNPGFNPSLPVSATNPQYLRDAFEGNVIPIERQNNVALKVIGDIPHGNVAGNSITGLNNWFAGQPATLSYYNSFLARMDHQIDENWKISGRWERSRLLGGITNPYQWTTRARQYNASMRWNDGAGIDVVGVLNPQTVLDLRLGYHRFTYGSNMVFQNLSDLGLPVTSQVQFHCRTPSLRVLFSPPDRVWDWPHRSAAACPSRTPIIRFLMYGSSLSVYSIRSRQRCSLTLLTSAPRRGTSE